jgi:hypothetical protein
MSDSYPENPRGVRQRVSRWSTTRRGTKTLKAAYAQAARDVKRMDPAVREAIGRSNMTRADLQQLASLHVDAQFRPDRYGDISQRLGAEAAARTNAAPGQTRNPLRRIGNSVSRWQDRRRGTKALKAAFTQAARDVKRTDPKVRWEIGRSHINRADLAALASSRMDEVFRPEGRFQNVPGQQNQNGAGQQNENGAGRQNQNGAGRQNQNGAGRQGPGIQSRDAVRQPPSPQQSEQMTQRIATLQQSIIENQQRVISLMEENNRLQTDMRQLLDARVQQLQQENSANPSLEPGQQREGANQLEGSDQQQGEARTEGEPQARTEGEAEVGEPRAEAEGNEPRAAGEAEVGDEPRARGEQAESGERPVGEAESGERPAVGDAEVGEDNGPEVGDGGDPQATQSGPAVEGAEPQAAPAVEPSSAERWTGSAATQGQSVLEAEAQQDRQNAPATTPEPSVDPQQTNTNPQQPGTNPQQPGVNGQQPGTNPQQPGVSGQQPGANPQQAGVNGQPRFNVQPQQGSAAGEKSSAELDAKFAQDKALGGSTPLNSVSSSGSDKAVKEGGDDANRRQRGGQAPTRSGPTGREG